MSAYTFKAGEAYKTEGGWSAKVVFEDKGHLLVVHEKRRGVFSSAWHRRDGKVVNSQDPDWSLMPNIPPMIRAELDPNGKPVFLAYEDGSRFYLNVNTAMAAFKEVIVEFDGCTMTYAKAEKKGGAS